MWRLIVGLILIIVVVLPLLEVVLLWRLAWGWGLELTLGWVLITGLLGVLMLRHRGVVFVRHLLWTMRQGLEPDAILVDSLLMLLAIICLIIPGILTDILGLGLLWPAVRHRVRLPLQTWIRKNLWVRLTIR